MPARIAKYPPIQGVGSDLHAVMPPSVPPPPPAPPNPSPIPTYTWLVAVTNPLPGLAISGKWSWKRVTTEGVGNILMGHDWGMGQSHVPMPPVVATPSIAIRTLGSSTKYWLSSAPNQEPQDGSPPGVQGPAGSVAVSTPAYVVCTQNCQDVNFWGFFLPTSLCFQLVSTREVGFTLGDLVNGVVNMAFDSAAALASRALGGPPGAAANELQSAIVGAAVGATLSVALAIVPPEDRGKAKMFLAPAAAIGAGGGASGAASAFVGAFCDWAAGEVGGAAQQGIDGERSPDEGALDHGGTPIF